MPALALFLILFFFASGLNAQTSPHGRIRYACDACHTTESWEMREDAAFDHGDTGFPLAGQHASPACVECHEALRFAGTASACTACHTDVHRTELGETCLRCHTTQSWEITDMLSKHQETRFPLLGAHVAVDCQSCHLQAADRQYRGTPVACIGCHRTDYQQTRNPSHLAAGFSSRCEACHQASALTWGTGFEHALVGFPLTGAHRAVACDACHDNGVFAAIPTACLSCHQARFTATANPDHLASGFSTNCETCHTTFAWTPATFDHNATRFALTGRHAGLDCRACHAGGNYRLTYTDCFACHQSDFQRPTNPNHVVANFSHACETCHTTGGWRPSTFDHDRQFFRIYSGEHRGTWSTCSACHQNATTYADFTCLTCHEHRQSKMDAEHRGEVRGYVYASPACFSCHRGV